MYYSANEVSLSTDDLHNTARLVVQSNTRNDVAHELHVTSAWADSSSLKSKSSNSNQLQFKPSLHQFDKFMMEMFKYV